MNNFKIFSMRSKSITCMTLISIIILICCKAEEMPYVHNYKGNWGFCESWDCIEFKFNDTLNQYFKYIDAGNGPCGHWLDSKSYIQVEEYDEGVLHIFQDSCFKYDYTYYSDKSIECDSVDITIIKSEFTGNIIVEYNGIMRYRDFYLQYETIGDSMKINYYINPQDIPTSIEGEHHTCYRVPDDDERFSSAYY
jgi:hypothetical protein